MSFRSSRRQHNIPAALPATLNDCQVLRFSEWVKLAGISARTGRRILASGAGPKLIQLSSKRVGVTVGAHRAWLVARERAGAAQ